MRPNFLTECLNDIQRNREFIAGYSPVAAQQFVDGIFAKVEQLLTFPQLGRVVPELGRPTVREVFYRQYRIIYQLMPDGQLTVIMVQSGRLPLDESRVA
jgi:plasmid stabilization system protein ParE